MAKAKVLSEKDRAIVAALKSTAPEPLDMSMIAELIKPLTIVSGNIVSAMSKGLIVKAGETEMPCTVKREVFTYSFVTDEVLKNEDGKEFNYTAGEKEILAAAKENFGTDGQPFILTHLAAAMGKDKLSSGSINGLVKKGNFVKGEKVQVYADSTRMVNVYALADDVDAVLATSDGAEKINQEQLKIY